MDKGAAYPLPLVEHGVASLTLAGERESGDCYLVEPTPTGVLAMVVDGLGHGSEAAEAARIAVAAVRRHCNESLISIIKRCHEKLRTTRGVVMSIASFQAADNTVTWLSVGNVEGVLMRADTNCSPAVENIVMRGGVVGYSLPILKAVVLPVMAGDTLIFATDGIRNGFARPSALSGSVQKVADHICTDYCKRTDDALVLVLRYLGKSP